MLFWGVRCPLNMVHVWLWFDYIYFPHINLSHVGNCDSDTFLEMSQEKNVPTNHSVDPTKMKRIFWKAWLVKLFHLFGSSCVKVWHLQLKGGHSENSLLMYISKQFCSWQRKKRIPFSSSFFMKKNPRTKHCSSFSEVSFTNVGRLITLREKWDENTNHSSRQRIARQ